jgi:DNA replication and repair protein RecF
VTAAPFAQPARAALGSLSIRDFRNLQRTELEVPEEGAVVVGANGQGKTNLLEAIYYLQLFRSVRGARDAELVRFGAPGFHLRGAVTGAVAREVSVGFLRQGKRKKVEVDGAEAERLSDAIGAIPSVMWSPADVELVAGAPGARRRYLDVMLALSSRVYLSALQRYRGALLRRNAALKGAAVRGAGAREDRVAVWEPVLAQAGAVLWAERLSWVRSISGTFASLSAEIGETAAASVRYASSAEESGTLEDALRDALAARRAGDVKRAMTSVGPHRDDLVLALDSRDLRTYGSGGQQRTAAIALRMLEAATLRERRGTQPLFLLDDPFAELDDGRVERIVRLLGDGGFGQIVMTVPRAADVPRGLPSLKRYRVEEGVIEEARPDGA